MAARTQAQNRLLPILFLGGTLIAAVGAGYFVLQVVNRSQQLAAAASKPKETIGVVVAVHDLYMGVPITDQDVMITQLDPVMITQETTFRTLDEVRGRTPRERILVNELVREERLARPDAGVGLNAIIAPGKRAFTVATDTETAVAGLLQPGNYVDIIVTIRPENPDQVGAKWVAKTILEGIKILAVGNNLSSQSGPVDPKDKNARPATNMRNIKPSITLELMPDEAEMLALAVSQGDVHVTLRTDTDFTQMKNDGVMTARQLIGLTADGNPQPQQAVTRAATGGTKTEAAPGERAEVVQGGSKTEIVFGADGSTTEKTTKNRNR